MASLNVGNLGEYLREQRRSAQLSLRQLAEAAGVSNPYLSQIERGLRKPSAEILQQLAKALRISAETLYVQAGILDERDRDGVEVRAAILADLSITEKQKQVLLQIYDSFRKETSAAAQTAAQPAADAPSAASDPAAAWLTGRPATADGAERTGSFGKSSRVLGGAAAKKAAKKAAAKVADAVAEAVAETTRSRARALKDVPSHDDDKGDAKNTSNTVSTESINHITDTSDTDGAGQRTAKDGDTAAGAGA